MTRSEKEIRRVELEAAAREAARRPWPWWEGRQLAGRNTIIANKLRELAGQEAVVLVSEHADAIYPLLAGPARVTVSVSPVDEGDRFGWASVGDVFHGFLLGRIEGVFSLEEARECEVLP